MGKTRTMSTKRFRIALSFADEKRDFVKQVADLLAKRFSEEEILYDKYHEAEFSRVRLGRYLPRLYHEESELVVVMICQDYGDKEWCGLEWDAIFDLLKKRRQNDVMFANFDRASVEGLYSDTGYCELDHKTPEQFVNLILERLAFIGGKSRDFYIRKSSEIESQASVIIRNTDDWTTYQDVDLSFAPKIRGGRPLTGGFVIRGAKNTLPKIILASLLTNETCILRNVARVQDVFTMFEAIRLLGGSVRPIGCDAVELRSSSVSADNINKLLALDGTSRVNVLMLGPLLHRFGRVVMPQIGGCNLGERSISFHTAALKQMGVTIAKEGSNIIAFAEDGIQGAQIELQLPSVGATEQVILAAVRAKGVTVLTNAATDPEVNDLILALREMGANIAWNNPRELVIYGVPELGGFDHYAMSDRSEIGSWASLALAVNGAIELKNVSEQDVEGFNSVFNQAGGKIEKSPEGIVFTRQTDSIQPIQIETGGHPLFRSDWQPPMVAALSFASGPSIVHETVFEDRLSFATSLMQMGLRIDLRSYCLGGITCRFSGLHPHSAVITPARRIRGADLTINDIRGGFATLIATLVADDDSRIRRFGLLVKGYEHMTSKCQQIGVTLN